MYARALLFLVASLAICRAEKPLVYNPVDGEDSPRGKATVAALRAKYSIVEIPQNADYANPKFTSGGIPCVARAADGKFIGGEVSMGCVITDQGKASDVVILKSSDRRLNQTTLDAVEKWRFNPATLKGKPISIVAGGGFQFQTPPTEFVTQVLEPTGGKIERPKEWFYAEGGAKGGYLWTISREDLAREKQYLTGVRIQLIAGIKKETGKSPQEFIREFVENKKKQADRVIETCEPKEQDLFTRTCLQTEEGPFRILYSLFWGTDDLDLAVVVIAGTPKELWEVYSPTFDKMAAFELIDMKRFESQ